MARVETVVGFGGYDSDFVTEKMHGTNMLFHTDRTGENSDFRQVIEKIGTEFVRFPGGTITELYFDLANPNATSADNVLGETNANGDVKTKEQLTGLTEYLSYKSELGGDPVIVIPTYRYFDTDMREITRESEIEIRTFIRELMTDQYGEVEKVTIELGNEYYQARFDWTDSEFGELQSRIASWIDEEARDLGVRDDLMILAQAGRSEAANKDIVEFFGGEAAATVDGIITHFYGTNSSGNPLGIGSGVGKRLDMLNSVWSQALGDDFEIAVTEWNVGDDGEANTLINGTMRSAPLLRMYAEMLEGGVDMAMIWSAQTSGPSGLSGTEGRGSDLSPTGLLFCMLAESTQGTRLVDQGGAFKLRDADGKTVGYQYTFQGEDRSVTYFASGVGQSFKLDASMAAYFDPDAYVYARILDVAPGHELGDFWSDAALTYKTDIKLTGSGNIFSHTFNPYQLVELHVVMGQGVRLHGDAEHDMNDRLVGGRHNDELIGNGGNDFLRGKNGEDHIEGGFGKDSLHGNKGEDFLDGGDGNDRLFGGKGDDMLLGGNGNDRLRGHTGDDELHGGEGRDVLSAGRGNDTLSGGEGNDTLRGNRGNDRLDGGAGDDILIGGSGRDEFVFGHDGPSSDRIMDFQKGQDHIDLTAFNLGDFQSVEDRSTDRSGGVYIELDAGVSIWVRGLSKAEMDADDFLL